MGDVEMVPTLLNGRWSLLLPAHRAARPEWGRWTDAHGKTREGFEVERLAAEHDEIKRLIAANPDRRPVVIDVGTEEGDMTALFSLWGADVVMVEPNPRVWPNVRAIWEANELRPPLAWWVGFLGAEEDLRPTVLPEMSQAMAPDGWPEVAHGPVIGDHGFRHLAEEADVTPTMRLTTLARYGPTYWNASPRAVDVITIDAEGAELEILKGAVEVLDEDRPTVFVSVHDEFLRHHFGQTREDVLSFLHGHGYTTETLAVDHEEHVVARPVPL